ncbi:MAG TPA: T9SS type A sorting domain-containing protein, partial [Chitinophagaceae bacterium]
LPNPVLNQLRINITLNNATNAQILISDAAGRKIGSITKQLFSGTNSLTHNTANWAHGVYFMKVLLSNGNSKSVKIVK